MPLELLYLCGFNGMGIDFNLKKTHDRYLQNAWLHMRFLEDVGLGSPMANMTTIRKKLLENENMVIYEDLLDRYKTNV